MSLISYSLRPATISTRPNVIGDGITMRQVTYERGDVPVLRNASLDVPKGETCVIRGVNGCGKSTLMFVCAGLVKVQRGSVHLAGHRADPDRPGETFRKGARCGFVFQEGGLVSNMNVLANVAIALRYHADILGIDVHEVERRAVAALERVNIKSDDYYALPSHLSFGVRRRLALARAIALRPNFFFFDDPDVGLDPDTAALVHEILCGYREDPEVTTMVATNRAILIERLSVPTYTLDAGLLTEYHPIVA